MSHLLNIAKAVADSGIDFAKGITASEGERLVTDIARMDANLESDTVNNALAPVLLGSACYSKDAELPTGVKEVQLQGTKASNFNLEHFTMPRTDVEVATTLAFNTFGSKQDAYLEALFPTYVNNPKYRTIRVVVRTIYVIDDYKVTDTTFESIKENKRSIIEFMNDAESSPFGEDKLRLIPVKTSDTEEFLAANYTITVKSPLNGKEVTTSPFKAGKKIPLGYVAQDQVLLSKGVLNNTDILDDTVVLDKLYLTFSDADNTDRFEYSVKDYQGVKWRGTATGDEHDVEVIFNKRVSIPVKQWKLITGDDNNIFAGFANSLNALVDVQVIGSGNLRTKEFDVKVTEFTLAGATTAAGPVDESSRVYSNLKDAFAKYKPAENGYLIDTRFKNDNRRIKGLYLTSQGVGSTYGIRAKTPFYTKAPIGGLNGTLENTDADFMKGLIAGQKTQNRHSGYMTLINFLKEAKETYAKTNNPLSVVFDGPVQTIVKPYYKPIDMNMVDYLDSLQNEGRKTSIKAAIVDLLELEFDEMTISSGFENFIEASDYAYEVVVNAGSKFKRFLGSEVEINGRVAKVEYTNEKALRDSILLGYRGATINKEEHDPFCFGAFDFTPSVVSESTRTVDGTEVAVLLVNPIFEHIITNPVLTEVRIRGLDLAIKKLTVNVSQ